MGILQIVIVIAILVLLVKPAGTYLYHVFSNEPNRTDRIFGGMERGFSGSADSVSAKVCHGKDTRSAF